VTGPHNHGGPAHTVRTKAELARHIGDCHTTSDGTVTYTAWPPLHERLRWTRDELERAHQEMHR
jgi:hypothetical protein